MGLELLFELEDAPLFVYLLLGGRSLDPLPLGWLKGRNWVS